MKRGPRLYFSFRSPYTWLTVERLLAVVPDVHDQLEFIPYWDPDPRTEQAMAERGAEFHYAQMSKAKHLYILQDTKRLAQRLGLHMTWPVDIDPCWEIPHLAWLAARREGRGPEFFAAVTQARWDRGEDICDAAVIQRLGTSAGLDGAALAAAADDPEIRAEGIGCLVAAFEDDIFGIPYFRVGRHRYWGFDRLDAFLDTFLPGIGRGDQDRGPGPVPSRHQAQGAGHPDAERAPLAGVPASAQEKIGSYDTDTAGGCG